METILSRRDFGKTTKETLTQWDLSAGRGGPLSRLDRVFFSVGPLFTRRAFPRDAMSTGRGRDTSFNPTGEGAAATRQVSPNDLSSKKLLCASFCSHALKPGRRVLSSAARYFFVARMTIASLFVGHESAPPFALLLLRTAILRVFRVFPICLTDHSPTILFISPAMRRNRSATCILIKFGAFYSLILSVKKISGIRINCSRDFFLT